MGAGGGKPAPFDAVPDSRAGMRIATPPVLVVDVQVESRPRAGDREDVTAQEANRPAIRAIRSTGSRPRVNRWKGPWWSRDSC